ncbi:MAG: MFS transporter [Chloroflexi bacterium]|nr:MFS transporter [Chloroflexota bacterium]MBV9898477.1 MFS transporter [Chloroflexota bacterium]
MAAPVVTAEAAEPAEARGAFQRVFGALGENPHYRLYWFGNQANTLVMQMQQVANGYLAYTLTDSAAALGVVAFAQSAPMLVISPLGGVLADRLEKRAVLIWMQALQCAISLVIGVLVAIDRIEYWHLVVSAAIQGVSFAIMMPTRQSWIPQLIPRHDLTSALALNNAGMNAARIVGPSLAGVLIAVPWFGIKGVYFLRVLAFVWVMFTLLQIPIRGEPEASSSEADGWDRVRDLGVQLTSGLRYIWNHETLLSLFIFAVVTMLLGQSYQQLLPAYALGVFDVGAEGQGVMQAVVGVGGLVGSLSMAYLSRNPNRAKIQAYTGTALGFALMLFGLCSAFGWFFIALGALFLVGLTLDFNATINQTLIMLNADRALYGRVMAVYMMTWALSGFSASLSGVLMDHVGGAITMLSQGLILAVFVVLMASLNGGYRKIRNSIS